MNLASFRMLVEIFIKLLTMIFFLSKQILNEVKAKNVFNFLIQMLLRNFPHIRKIYLY